MTEEELRLEAELRAKIPDLDDLLKDVKERYKAAEGAMLDEAEKHAKEHDRIAHAGRQHFAK